MKRQKITALMLSAAMVLGSVAACSSNEPATTTAATTAAPATEATEAEATEAEETEATEAAETTEAQVEANTGDYFELPVQEVVDEGDGKIMIYGWNTEFIDLVTKYTGIEYDSTIKESNSYQAALDTALSSGDNAPDLFVCDADYATKYMNSDNTIAINNIGISYSELGDMYNYTLQFACDDANVIKGLSWQATPCGVFYNTVVAQEVLGVSEPDEVAPYFASWEAFAETAALVNEKSNGEVKVVSGTDEIWRAYLNTREQGWITDSKELYVDPVLEGYFDLAKTLKQDNLTFEAGQWGEGWNANMANHKVLSYWGPMWLPNYCFNFGSTNDTAGEWRVVMGPTEYFWGGTWMMASKYCQYKATSAQIMRDISLNEDTLKDIAQSGDFVNSVSIMEGLANDPNFGIEIFGGQNAAAVLYPSSTSIDNSTVGKDDQKINDEFGSVVSSYINGDIETVPEALKVFEDNLAELNII